MSPPPSSALLLHLLLLLSPAIASGQLISFNLSSSPWLPTDNRTLLSPNRTFAAGFRPSPTSPSLHLFSIFVQPSTAKTVIWSLNPDRPLPSSASLSLSPLGTLSLADPSSNYTFTFPSNATQLLLTDYGSLVFGGWTSSDSPTDTVLPNQTVPTSGAASLISGNFHLVNASGLIFNNSYSYWTAAATIRNLTSGGILLMDNNNQIVTSDLGKAVLRRMTLDADGNLRIYSLNRNTGRWRVVWQAVQELCTIAGTCGTNAICVPVGSNATSCVCPPGYRNVSSGCQLKLSYIPPQSKFLRLDFVSFYNEPGNSRELTPVDFARCQSSCLANSSCVAFSYKYTGTQNCFHHFNRLIYGYWSPSSENSTFIRVSNSETDSSNFTGMTAMIDTVCPVRVSLPLPPKESKTTVRNLAIIGTLFSLELLAGVLSFWAFLRKYSKYRNMARTFGLELLPAGGPKRFSYAELKAATNDFSQVVGHGGYGVVFKGELPDGRVIAVKRLKNVGVGEAEFWAEVTIIARMHHLNLVRLWGFCAEKVQRMLVYEYISNGSLDKYLFPRLNNTGEEQRRVDQSSNERVHPRPLQDWSIRYRIALGVARAIAYLHEECLEWVLHCDIKPENILLEDDFCPKVSDFGLSKLTNKKDKVTMSKIRGTRGYLAPEWVIQREPITAKADVYSFGMVLLEIVTGVRNYEFQRESLESEDWYFPRWAFDKVYVERRVEDILDPLIMESYDDRAHLAMVERMVKTAMSCLQDRAEMRPSMGKVAKMLEGTVEITEPVRPSIFYTAEE